jgi:hypothetical protein
MENHGKPPMLTMPCLFWWNPKFVFFCGKGVCLLGKKKPGVRCPVCFP